MVLGFKKQFKEPILNGSKIHTIREDKHNRWNPGMEIHFATGVRTKNYNQFYSGMCVSVQKIMVVNFGYPHTFIDAIRFLDVGQLVRNDGFKDRTEFYKWFVPKLGDVFRGKIIHWTELKY